MRFARLCLTLPLLFLVGGCPNPNMAPPAGIPYAGASPSPNDGLTGLVKEATEAEKQVEENLNTPLTLSFPVRLGVLFFAYGPALKPEDQQAVLNQVKADLAATNLVRSTVLLPAGLTQPTDSLETIRKLASRFGVDTLLVVSGRHEFQRADSQPLGFFDAFSNRAHYEARTSLTALGMSVLTGRFLPPFQTTGKAGPELLNPDDGDFRARAYELQKAAETQAIMTLKNRFVEALQLVQTQPAPAPSPSPAPTQAPTPAPDAAATGEVAPSPTPTPAG